VPVGGSTTACLNFRNVFVNSLLHSCAELAGHLVRATGFACNILVLPSYRRGPALIPELISDGGGKVIARACVINRPETDACELYARSRPLEQGIGNPSWNLK
jgi:hypothetical protein